MLEIRVIDYCVAGFEHCRFFESEERLADSKNGERTETWCWDINEKPIGDRTIRDFPVGLLYEWRVSSSSVTRDELIAAKKHADQESRKAGLADDKGRKVFLLYALEGDDSRIWVRVGREFVE